MSNASIRLPDDQSGCSSLQYELLTRCLWRRVSPALGARHATAGRQHRVGVRFEARAPRTRWAS